MKIALGQINPTVGDLAGNVRLMVEAASQAAERGAERVVFPELAVTGLHEEANTWLWLRPGRKVV